MTKKYVLTGGPGTGKSTLLRALVKRGEYGIPEAAEDYIRRRQSGGAKEPWKEPDFQDMILELQVQRESDVPEGLERVFVDRGIPDGLAYAQPGTKTYWRILEEAAKVHYERVFIVEPLVRKTRQTEIRRENYEEASALGRKLEEIYEQLGYEIRRINQDTVEERVAIILQMGD